ncbi:MAG TPA: hypothetical protein DDZ38_12505, partial [Gammaproteobacteria bacterium]|nr:hypothetical protein [Gammaproteobacteria bacterium]
MEGRSGALFYCEFRRTGSSKNMMQNLREQTQSTGFKVLVVAIIIVLTFFGFGATNIFSSVQPSVATVGDFDVTENVLANE